IVGAALASALLIGTGALRSSQAPGATDAPPTVGTTSASTPPPATVTVPPADASTPAPPPETPVRSLHGEFVGGLGFSSGCMLLFVRGESYEMILPNGYRLRERDGRAVILDADRSVVAGEGDIVGVDGEVRPGGSFCIVGPQLHVAAIVDVLRRE
ncbi:MAG: hypothetical protein L0221_09755, partial [Chloroflexi bacterium]|nr:hypothetical protein [Chloroflexota bacterium]